MRITASEIRETEKALQLEVTYWTDATKADKHVKIWFPKKLVEKVSDYTYEVQNWFMNKWIEEEYPKYNKFASHVNINFNMKQKETNLDYIKKEQEKLDNKYKKFTEYTEDALYPQLSYYINMLIDIVDNGYFNEKPGSLDTAKQLIRLYTKNVPEDRKTDKMLNYGNDEWISKRTDEEMIDDIKYELEQTRRQAFSYNEHVHDNLYNKYGISAYNNEYYTLLEMTKDSKAIRLYNRMLKIFEK